MKKQRHFRGMFVLILAVSFAVGAGSGYVIKHRKTAATAESRVVAEAERDTAPIQVMQPEEGDTAPISDEEIPQTEIESESADNTEPDEPQIPQSDLDRKSDKIALLKESNAELEAKAAIYRRYANGLANEEIERLVQEKMLQCYEENTLLALEIKAFALESFGVSVPTGFSSEDDAWEDYKEYLKDDIINSVLSQFAPDYAVGLLRNGIDGAVDAYVEQGTLSDTLTGALSSVKDGVAATIQDDPLQTAVNILDETTGGMISTYENITGYDQTPTVLLQSLEENAQTSADQIKNYLNAESMTSRDIANLMYQYAQYGNSMDNLRYYAGGGTFAWQENYRRMQVLYERFLYNETCIQMLSTGSAPGNAGGDSEPESTQAESADGSYGQEQVIEEVLGNSEQAVRYRELLAEEASEQRINQALSAEIQGYRNGQNQMEAYRQQTQQATAAYEKLLEYSVMDFKAQYDEAGVNKIQENNKINNAIREITGKYVPRTYAWTINMFASMNLDDNNWYYNGIAAINQKFETAYQQAAVDTRDAVDTLKARLKVYEGLSESTDDLEQEFKNQYLFGYILNGGEIDLSAEWAAVERQMYILSAQIRLITDIYQTLLMSSNAKTQYIEEMNAQYHEIMEIIDPEGTGEAASRVTDEELLYYLKDMIDAAKSSLAMMEGYQAEPLGNVKSSYIYTDKGKTYLHRVNGQVSHVRVGGLEIYYAGNQPIYVDGYYCYRGRVLNPGETTDDAALTAEANWMKGVLGSRTEFEKVHYDALKKAE